MFDFDTVIERKGTDSLKYDFARERGKAEDVLPLWLRIWISGRHL